MIEKENAVLVLESSPLKLMNEASFLTPSFSLLTFISLPLFFCKINYNVNDFLKILTFSRKCLPILVMKQAPI